MTLPTLSKTWQFQLNNRVEYAGDAISTRRQILYKIKQLLCGFSQNPWVVVSSSNGTAVSTSSDRDLWKASSNVVFANSGAHSWIVLQQSGLGTSGTAQICIDCVGPYAKDYGATIYVWVSPAAGFVTGGTTTSARPTASDEFYMVHGDYRWVDGTDTNTSYAHNVHAMQATDGSCTRIITTRCGDQIDLFWVIDTAANPIAAWTNPIWTSGRADDKEVNWQASIARFIATNYFLRGRLQEVARNFCFVLEGAFTSAIVNSYTEFTNVSSFDKQSMLLRPLLAGDVSPIRGVLGVPVDIWVGPYARQQVGWLPGGFPEVGPPQLCQFGHIVLPWDGATYPTVV